MTSHIRMRCLGSFVPYTPGRNIYTPQASITRVYLDALYSSSSSSTTTTPHHNNSYSTTPPEKKPCTAKSNSNRPPITRISTPTRPTSRARNSTSTYPPPRATIMTPAMMPRIRCASVFGNWLMRYFLRITNIYMYIIYIYIYECICI